jgi:hypothetical protein
MRPGRQHGRLAIVQVFLAIRNPAAIQRNECAAEQSWSVEKNEWPSWTRYTNSSTNIDLKIIKLKHDDGGQRLKGAVSRPTTSERAKRSYPIARVDLPFSQGDPDGDWHPLKMVGFCRMPRCLCLLWMCPHLRLPLGERLIQNHGMRVLSFSRCVCLYSFAYRPLIL